MSVDRSTDKRHEKWMIPVLIGLGILIVGLVVAVIVVTVSKLNDEDGGDDDEVDPSLWTSIESDWTIVDVSGDEPRYIDCSKIRIDDDIEDIVSCMGVMEQESGDNDVLDFYKYAIDNAMKKGEFDRYVNLMNARASFLESTQGCDAALVSLEDGRVDGLAVTEKRDFYILAKDLAEYCENDEKVELYQSKILQASGVKE